MIHNILIAIPVALAFLICVFSSIKKRPALLLSLLGRSAAGLSYIYFFNMFCTSRGILTGLGINPATALLSAFLGIPGAMLAYGIRLTEYFF